MDITIVFIIIGVLFTIGLGFYIYLMIFKPEWVGITGKTAEKNLEEHQEGSSPKKDLDYFS